LIIKICLELDCWNLELSRGARVEVRTETTRLSPAETR